MAPTLGAEQSGHKSRYAYCHPVQGAEVKVTPVLSQGDPKHELPRAAEEWGADCIFVGSAGFSNRFERFVLGSVSAAVAARAHCSVEVVRQNSQQESVE